MEFRVTVTQQITSHNNALDHFPDTAHDLRCLRPCNLLVSFIWQGLYVRHALMKNESSECLIDAVTSFKSVNRTWEKVRVIIVDKEFGEISLLQTKFPGARTLLCVFYVVKYLRGEMVKREYGFLIAKRWRMLFT